MTKAKRREQPAAARPAVSGHDVAGAYRKTEKDILAMSDAQAGRVTADIPTAVSLALGALPHLEALRPEMVELLKHPPLAEIERLRDRAFAVLYADLQNIPATSRVDEELEEARRLRELLLAAADAHVTFGHIDAASVAQIREGSGHLDRANDCIALSALFRSAWPRIAGKTLVEEAQLDRASVLGASLVIALGEREVGPRNGDLSWNQLRTRAFRLFIDDYDQIRRAVEYVRWDRDDAANYAPPLHQRTRAKPQTEAEPSQT